MPDSHQYPCNLNLNKQFGKLVPDKGTDYCNFMFYTFDLNFLRDQRVKDLNIKDICHQVAKK